MADEKKDLEDFLSGKESEAGKKIFDQWYNSVPEKANPILEASDDVLREELKNIKNPKIVALHSPKKAYSFYWKAAAVALVVLTTGLFLMVEKLSTHSDAIAFAEHVVPRGKLIHLRMSDGTQIWLNSDSRLRYPKKFNEHNREVYLEGEAFFEVAKDPGRPFRIHSDGLTTTVLGTSFNVRSYTDDDVREVAVITGNVSVVHTKDDGSSPEINLRPGEKALLMKGKGEFSKLKFIDQDRYTSWTTGKLIFENAPVSEVIRSLQRRYNLEIRLESESLKNCRVTAEFDQLKIERIMYLLSYALNAKYSKTETGYLIQGPGCINKN